MNTLEKLKIDLINMGIKKGDTVLVRADLGSIGKLNTKKREDYINFMIDTVGNEGTIIGLSFTQSFNILRKKNNIVFYSKSKSYTGAFANTMLSHPKAIRSKHPTNSYVAIGKNAEYILSNHDENVGAYEPIRKIIELNGKMILIGCAGSSPGFTSTHLAEVDLGLHKRIIFPSLNGCFYRENNELKLFRRKDIGSCSSTFYKFYGYYIKNEILKQGYVGNAYSISINAKEAYDLDLKILKNDPKITICSDPNCLLCRARRWDNLKDIPMYIFRKIMNKIIK